MIHDEINNCLDNEFCEKLLNDNVQISQGFETALRLNLNLVVLILNDAGYGMIKWEQERLGFENYGLDFTNPDFVKYAESYGATGHRISKTEELNNNGRLKRNHFAALRKHGTKTCADNHQAV